MSATVTPTNPCHLTDLISHTSAKLDFIGDAFANSPEDEFRFSAAGQFGLMLLLRDLSADMLRAEQLLYQEREARP